MIILDGNLLASEIKAQLISRVQSLAIHPRRPPHLAAVLVGEDGASKSYVNHKVKMCADLGFRSTLLRLPNETTEAQLLAIISELNDREDLDGYIVQLPLPTHINPDRINQAIDYKKDVDGFHPVNIGRMTQGLPAYLPATPMGILQLLQRYEVPTAGKHCVIIGRSNIVGTPMGILLSRNNYPGNCTVTICHSLTPDLAFYTRQADIIIVALGKAEFIKVDMIKPGAVVIDVGITRVEDSSAKQGYVIKGDVAFEEVSNICSYITPVPGGVGPLTVTSLMQNTLRAYLQEVYTK